MLGSGLAVGGVTVRAAPRVDPSVKLKLGTGFGYDDNVFWRFEADPAHLTPASQRDPTSVPTVADGFWLLRPQVRGELWMAHRHRLRLDAGIEFQLYFRQSWVLFHRSRLSYRGRIWRQLWLGFGAGAELFERGKRAEERSWGVGGSLDLSWQRPLRYEVRLSYVPWFRRYPAGGRESDNKVQDDVEHRLVLVGAGRPRRWVQLEGGYLFGDLSSSKNFHDYRRHQLHVGMRFALPWKLRIGADVAFAVLELPRYHLPGAGSPSRRRDLLLKLGLAMSRPVGRYFNLFLRYQVQLNWGSWQGEGWRDHRQVFLAGATVGWGATRPTPLRLPPGLPRIGPAPTPGKRLVRFRLKSATARRVSVVGSFNGWRAEVGRMVRAKAGWWEVRLLLAPGRYEYTFWVDGHTIQRPPGAAAYIRDGFGGVNGILVVR